MKKSINIYLSGGGIKCAYQISFLNYLINNKEFNDKYVINNIYCVSFGGFVGYAYVNGTLDILQSIFLKFSNKSDILKKTFELWGIKYISMIPIIGKIICFLFDMIWLLKGIKEKGFYKFDIGYSMIKDLTSKNNKLDAFNCYVYNITKNKLECINGSHPLLHQYMIASCCYWGLFKPVFIQMLCNECECTSACYNICKINNNIYCQCSYHQYNEFIDAGIEQIHPFVNLLPSDLLCQSKDKQDDHIHLLLATENLKNNTVKVHTGNNIIEYLVNLINHNINKASLYMSKSWNKNNNIIINYQPPVNNPVDIDPIKINQMINDGSRMASEYLNQSMSSS